MNQTVFWQRFSAGIERWGNRLPAPALLFVGLWLLVIVLSSLASWAGWQALHPATQAQIQPNALISEEGVVWMLSTAVKNFTGFAPVGPVLVVMLGLGLAERSGLLGQWLQQLMRHLPGVGLTLGVVLVGILSSLAFDAGYVVVIPLSAVLFQLAGRSPLAGVAASFAAVSGGYSANLMVGPVDTVLSGISTESARLVDPSAAVSLVSNYYFMATSTVFMTLVISFVLHRWVEPMLSNDQTEVLPVFDDQQRGAARVSLWFFMALSLLLLLAGTVPGAWLAGSEGFLKSPFMRNLSVLIGLSFGVSGALYGRLSGRYSSSHKLVEDLEETFRSLAPYLVLMFFAAQFVAAFSWSNLGLLVAIEGASVLQVLALPETLTLVVLIMLVAVINLLLGSASAKWALLAPVLVPMLMLLGINPEVTQVAYRIGDSSTNIITPLMPYFPLVLALVQKYRNDAGVGTVLAMMMPFSLMMVFSWSVFLALWLALAIPLGPQ